MELKDLEPFLEKIVKIDRTKEAPASAKDSYIGGYPFVPSNGQTWEWPRTEEGNPLVFIVQINFAEVPKGYGYPESGMLQVFVDLNDYYGTREALRVVVYTAEELSVESVSKPSDVGPTVEDWTPFWEEYSPRKIEFKESLQIPSELYRSASWSDDGEGLEGKEKELYDLFEKTDGDISEEFQYLAEHHHQLGGEPLWVQGAVFESDEVPTFMLQIDSDFANDDDFLMFGDAGNLHVFGDLEKLKAGDVSEFSWEWACY
jgi:uncharacterized protein YwqG